MNIQVLADECTLTVEQLIELLQQVKDQNKLVWTYAYDDIGVSSKISITVYDDCVTITSG